MDKIIALIKLLIAIGPGVIALVVEMEKLFPESGQGAVKLAIVKAYVQKAFDFVGGALPTFESVWPKIAEGIALIVSLLNGAGIFTTNKEA
jgi:hypothetical protein